MSKTNPPLVTRRRTSWRKKAAFTACVLVTVFVTFELILTVCGVRPFRKVQDPFLDFEPGIPLFVREGSDFVTNPIKRTNFNDQAFPCQKPANSMRIFCLGGSTTYGRPYQDGFSYVAGLRSLLKELEPGRDWQVVTKAVHHPADQAAPLSFRIGVRISLGDCLTQIGDITAARQLYRDAYQIDPHSTIAKERFTHGLRIPPTDKLQNSSPAPSQCTVPNQEPLRRSELN